MPLSDATKDVMAAGFMRKQYAWLPVRRFLNPDPFTAPEGWYWLTATIQTRSAMDGWIAYASDNTQARRFTCAQVTAVGTTALWLAAALSAWAIHAIVVRLSLSFG